MGMARAGTLIVSLAPWHALLAPLPAGSVATRKPLAAPEALAPPIGSALDGWSSVTLELPAGAAGLRIVTATLDGGGRLVSASDHVVFRSPDGRDAASPGTVRQESVGGRIEIDGSFQGTCWLVTGPEPVDNEDPRWDMTSRPPTDAEIDALMSLVEELLRRAL